jgi:hypothetical protein
VRPSKVLVEHFVFTRLFLKTHPDNQPERASVRFRTHKPWLAPCG